VKPRSQITGERPGWLVTAVEPLRECRVQTCRCRWRRSRYWPRLLISERVTVKGMAVCLAERGSGASAPTENTWKSSHHKRPLRRPDSALIQRATPPAVGTAIALGRDFADEAFKVATNIVMPRNGDKDRNETHRPLRSYS